MFESAELGHQIDKATWQKEEPLLRQALLEMQLELVKRREFPVVILASGIDGAGRREAVNLLNEWMDPRHIQSHGMGEPSDEESERPPMWRYWRKLPPKGKIGVFLGTWYTDPLLARVYGEIDSIRFREEIESVVRFERMLTEEGALVLKFWFHLSKDRQEKRLKALEKDPETRWRVTERDWAHFQRYDDFRVASEELISITSTAHAPWYLIDGSDVRYRSLAMGKILLEALRVRLAQKGLPAPEMAAPLPPQIDNRHILGSLQLAQKLTERDYKKELEALQGRLNLLMRDPRFARISVVIVFEGNDAAGKGSAIRRITAAMDARYYQIVPVVAPTDEERAHPYLWRFWRQLPRRGHFTIFDRSWYGRVLVERVEGFCKDHDWLRAYGEINDFEAQMVRHDIIVIKYWLAISKDEQLTRFNAREQIEFKRFKITEEDWRNRDQWDAYTRAVCDMVDRTSTRTAPWILVEANNKLYARIKVLRTLCERIEAQYDSLGGSKKKKA
jgi:polyphosphate:AMP phosphotransferase